MTSHYAVKQAVRTKTMRLWGYTPR